MTSTADKARIPKPESLEAKFALLCRLPYDQRARRKHALVFGFILDWYHSKYGDALASVRHVAGKLQERDPAGKGLYIGEIHSALSDLVEWNYLLQEKGKGRRASRYVPNWLLLEPSVQQIPNATEDDRSVLDSPNTGVLDSPNTTGRSVRDFMNEDPSTMTRVLDPGTWKDELDCAAPTAPAGAGPLGAAPPETAQEDSESIPTDHSKWFNHLYAVYGVRKGKADARRVFDKMAPNLAHFTGMIEAAREWRAAAGGIERKWLATWLRDECFDEEPSQPKDRQAKGATKNTATSTARTMKIIKAQESGNPFGGDFYVDVEFEDDTAIISRKYHVLAGGGDGPDNETWLSLVRAIGDLKVGRLVGVERDGEKLTFSTIEQPDYVEPPLPSPPSAPMTEAEIEAVRAKIAALPPLAPRLNEWQRLKEEQWRRDADRREWDAAHPELFEDEGWPDWMDADQDDEAA